MSECAICVEPYSTQKRKAIKCEYCDFEACKQCMERYILLESAPKCMNGDCNRPWTNKFIASNFAHNFVVGKLKTHKENVLFDKERALLPATQPIVENMIAAEKIDAEIHEEYKRIREIERRISSKRIERNRLMNRNVNRERARFIKACPDERCRGFLSSQWKCGICSNFFCPDCHENKGPDRDMPHECDEELKATIALISNDTKSCPNCGVGISKIDGCDQMWCPDCHTAFSWRTGRIETNIHNPHYYEWMRRTGGEIPANHNEVQCGREIDNYFARALEHRLSTNPATYCFRRFVRETCRMLIHYRFAVIERYRVDDILNNQDLRVRYLRNLMNEDEFKAILQKNDKKNSKKRDIYLVYIMFINTATDILYRFMDILGDRDDINDDKQRLLIDTLNEVKHIVKYSNECLDEIEKTYKCKVSKLMGGNLWIENNEYM